MIQEHTGNIIEGNCDNDVREFHFTAGTFFLFFFLLWFVLMWSLFEALEILVVFVNFRCWIWLCSLLPVWFVNPHRRFRKYCNFWLLIYFYNFSTVSDKYLRHNYGPVHFPYVDHSIGLSKTFLFSIIGTVRQPLYFSQGLY